MSGAPASQGSPAALGPVSAAAVAGLREEARKHGVLVWLDKDGTYTSLVEALAAGAGDFPFPLFAYRGSFLELMLALDGHEDGVTMQPLVLHMPGFNEEEVARTPAYELYRSGRRYRLALPTLVRSAAEGKVPPAQIEATLQGGLSTLEEADDWLAAAMRDPRGPELPVSSPQQLFDDLAANGPVTQGLADPAMLHAALGYLERTLGLDTSWRAGSVGDDRLGDSGDLQLLMSSWALCVEFVHDLKRPPKDAFLQPLQQLPRNAVESSQALAAHIRSAHPETYARDADQVEADLLLEAREATAEDLGRIDTLRFEDRKVFAAALAALNAGRWEQAAGYAAERTEERSFWVRHDPGRRTAWPLIGLAAELGLACARHEGLLQGVSGLEDAARRYAEGGFEVDSAQRRLEQARSQLLLVQLDEFPALQQSLNGLRRVYRRWADDLARTFNALCRKHGFLPEPAMQQRTLFDEVVRPQVEAGGPVAYFVVDALRFELARQLADGLGKESGAKLQLEPRYAELPTLTEVGMNVLAPVARNGRLRPDIDLGAGSILGFRAAEARVATPKARQKAMHERVGGETCPWLPLEDLLERDVTSVRQAVSRARLVVVHAEGLDKAGEKGVGLRHFEDELQRLRAAWFRLRDAGVRRFVVTADHGFLLQDDTTRQPVPHGRKIDPKRRHVIESHAADHEGAVRVSSTDLRYDGDEVQLVFPESSMPFDTGGQAKEFLHGGNSLQERLIPVLTAEYRHAKGLAALQYRVEAEARPGVMGLHRIEGTVAQAAQRGLSFGGRREVELCLHALDQPDVAVELVDAPGARIEAGALVATVDTGFELLFRLTGPRPLRAQVALQAALGGDDILPTTLERRFTVDVTGAPESEPEPTAPGPSTWLENLPAGGVRDVFAHIERFGAINEADATAKLGSPRHFRRFASRFEEYAERAPFELRIDVSSGQKRYLRD